MADTGSGIDAAVMPRLFEPFVQADARSNRAGGGLGLGLALVRGLVELHGGEVTAHSAGGGQGATFVVRLPLAGRTRRDEDGRRPVEAPRRVLVIDDDRDVRTGSSSRSRSTVTTWPSPTTASTVSKWPAASSRTRAL